LFEGGKMEFVTNLKQQMKKNHTAISPTAYLTAVLRAHSGIEYAEEFSKACGAETITKEFFGDEYDMALKMRSAFAERRFRALDIIIDRYKTNTIVELASGMATHGLIFSKDPHVQYIETDLPELIRYKEEVIQNVLSESRTNLFFKELNALKSDDYQKVFQDLEGPVTVVNEGLLMYLSHEEIEIVAKNVYELLKEKGGVWINPDIFLRDMYKQFTEILQTRGTDSVFKTGSSTLDNCFESFDVAEKLFTEIGFSIERFVQTELVPHVTSYTTDEMDKIMSQQEVWVLRVQ
jgi:O-methyltransferase involved in polyketide biosynthesis